MRLKNFHLKLKGIRIKRFLIGNGRRKSLKPENGKNTSWMTHIEHGYQVVESDKAWESGVREFDSIVVQREQIQQCDLWFFGIFDDGIGGVVVKYMQSNFFDKIPKESRIAKVSKQTMKKAHSNARAQLKDKEGAASAMVIDGKKLVIASMGHCKVVLCRDGEAFPICRRKQHSSLMHWSLKLFPGALHPSKANEKKSKSSKVIVWTERIVPEIEFVILANSGVWEVMKDQESVNLIRHIEDPKEAAECLATEALSRMSKSKISCLIIRFD